MKCKLMFVVIFSFSLKLIFPEVDELKNAHGYNHLDKMRLEAALLAVVVNTQNVCLHKNTAVHRNTMNALLSL